MRDSTKLGLNCGREPRGGGEEGDPPVAVARPGEAWMAWPRSDGAFPAIASRPPAVGCPSVAVGDRHVAA